MICTKIICRSREPFDSQTVREQGTVTSSEAEMGKPQFQRDSAGRFVSKTLSVKVPKPEAEYTGQRFGRLHSALKSRRSGEMSPFAVGANIPAYDDMYDLYSHYDD